MARRFNYIITIHNKEDMIQRVLTAVLLCAGENSHIYPVLDGCTDRTEAMIDDMLRAFDNLPVTKLYAPDVHEIRSVNIALRQLPQDGDGYNVILQDDVILEDGLFEDKVKAVYDHFDGKIGILSFRHAANIALDDTNQMVSEVDLVGSVYANVNADSPILPGQVAKRMVSVGSPECISMRIVREIGILNENLAPYTYDLHDYCLRCFKAGYRNYVYAVKFVSDVNWGGMRQTPQPNAQAIMLRNRHILYRDHADYIRAMDRAEFLQPAIDVTRHMPSEDDESALRRYSEDRRKLSAYLAKQRGSLSTAKGLLEALQLKWKAR